MALVCAGCGVEAAVGVSLTHTGSRWLCDPCWREQFHEEPPKYGVRS